MQRMSEIAARSDIDFVKASNAVAALRQEHERLWLLSLQTTNTKKKEEIRSQKAALRERLDKAAFEVNRVKELARNQAFDELISHHDGSLARTKIETNETLKRFNNRSSIEYGADIFKQMIGPGTPIDDQPAILSTTTSGRAFYDPAYREVRFTASDTAKVAVHELGHHLEEWDEDVRLAARDFYVRRTVGHTAVQLKTVAPKNGYDDEEYTKPDKFFDPYVGKVYPWSQGRSSTEIVAMGLERMYDDPIGFAKADPEHFKLIYSIMRRRN